MRPTRDEPAHRRLRRAVRRFVLSHRRPLAALLVFVAVLSGLAAVRPDAPATAAVVVAARDLRSGVLLGVDDLTVRRVDPASVPDGALRSTTSLGGRRVAAPVRAGSALTDWSLVRDSLLDGYPDGSVLSTVRVADPASLGGLRVGDHVHVVASDPRAERPPSVLARRVQVAAVPPGGSGGWEDDGGVVVVALPEDVALAMAEASGRDRIDVVVTS